jgi:hypothetical protein
MDRNDEIRQGLEDLFKAMKRLRELGVLNQNRDITSQVGEWLVEALFDGRRAENGINKDWDVQVGSRYVQVKTHAKAAKNTARLSSVTYGSDARIDELMICVFSSDYRLKEFYRVPWQECLPLIRMEKDGGKVYWNHISRFRIDIPSLPRPEIVNMFL